MCASQKTIRLGILLTAILFIHSPLSAQDGAIQLTTNTGEDRTPAWSPDGSEVAFKSYRTGSWEIFRIPIEGGAAIQVTFAGTHPHSVNWSPDGTQMCFHGLNWSSIRIETVTVATGDMEAIVHNDGLHLPDWSPDGGRLIYPLRAGQYTAYLWFYDFATDTHTQFTYTIASSTSPDWSPDGSMIAYRCTDGLAPVWTPTGLRSRRARAPRG